MGTAMDSEAGVPESQGLPSPDGSSRTQCTISSIISTASIWGGGEGQDPGGGCVLTQVLACRGPRTQLWGGRAVFPLALIGHLHRGPALCLALGWLLGTMVDWSLSAQGHCRGAGMLKDEGDFWGAILVYTQ